MYRRKCFNFGLGLANAKPFDDRVGGNISIESQEVIRKHGHTFLFASEK